MSERLHGRAASGGTDGPALVLTQDAESISGACLAIQGQSGANLFYGHVEQLLLGEAQARQGVYAALEYGEHPGDKPLDFITLCIRIGFEED